jgi:hypothetical protein
LPSFLCTFLGRPHNATPLHHTPQHTTQTLIRRNTSHYATPHATHDSESPINTLTGNAHHLTLAMSTPPDQPAASAYRIDPDIQCGVVKDDGNRCTARLSCKVHTEKDKAAVGDRTKSYAKLLKVQPESIALDPRPTSRSADDPDQRRFAPVFDPDMHCGADLDTGFGEPCAVDLLVCKTHKYIQQANVLG